MDRLFTAGCVAALIIAGCADAPTGKAPALPTAPAQNEDVDMDLDLESFETTASGLKYKIVEPGGEQKPTADNGVRVHYRGTLMNGQQFDSSYDRGEPIEFELRGVIPGWTEGLQLIGEGGKLELVIPPDLAYGARGAGSDIPPNSTLHFTVELLKIL